MTITISGSLGSAFDIIETDTALATGTVTQQHTISTDLSAITLAATDLVASLNISVGTTAFDIDFNDLDNASGTGYTLSVVRNQDVDLTSIKGLVIHNTHASNTLTIGSPSANSLFTWNSTSDNIILDANGVMSFYFKSGSEKAITTNGKLNIVGSASSTTVEVYVIGT